MFGGRKNKTGTQRNSGQPNKKAAKRLVTDLYVAYKHNEATQVEILQKVFHTNYQQMGDKEVIVTTESPPSPPAVDVNLFINHALWSNHASLAHGSTSHSVRDVELEEKDTEGGNKDKVQLDDLTDRVIV